MKVVFLDRDGVINKEVGYLNKVDDFEFIDGVFTSCLNFQSLGYQMIIVTNQSGIGRGYYDESDFHQLTKWMLTQFKQHGVNILDVFFCPHGPESDCDCRKPKPGMFLQANNKYDIDMKNSWMIGDKEADIQAANMAGISNTVLVKSGHQINEKTSKAKFILDSIDQLAVIL
jgi:D-glycero-D-manno-heptose 1,7-bisphosphate phosphatase